MLLSGPPHRARRAATTGAGGSELARSDGDVANRRAEVMLELDLWLTLEEVQSRGALIPLAER